MMIFLIQFYDAVGWMTGRASGAVKTLCSNPQRRFHKALAKTGLIPLK